MTTTIQPIGAMMLAALLAGCGAAQDTPDAQLEHAEASPDMVHLDSAAIAAAEIRVDTVIAVSGPGLSITGTITYDANRVSHIGSRTPGRVLEVRADLGERVRPGQVLAVLESPEVGQLRSEAIEAEALTAIARENFERERRLEEQGIASRKERLAAEAELRRAEATLQGAQERLRVLGAGGGTGGEFTVTAPFAGHVVERHITRGEMVHPEDQLFVVADLQRVWVLLDVFERDLSTLGNGTHVSLATPAWPDRTFSGRIVYVAPVLDTVTRTVRARIEVPNPDGALRPGMFATAKVDRDGDGGLLPAVPRAAIQELEGRTVAFVPGNEPGTFRAVPVSIGADLSGGLVTVTSGLAVGDSLVVAGAFLLRSELAAGEIGEHGH